MKRNIIFANQATGYLTLDIVNAFAESGRFDSTVIFAGEINIRPTKPLQNVKVVKSKKYNKKSVFTRFMSWTIYFFHLLFYIWSKPNSYELFLITNPPFNVFIPLFTRKKFSILIYDIYPDTIVSQKVVSDNSWLIRLWKHINVKVYNKAKNVFTISEDMKSVVSAYVQKDKISVVYNWGHNEHMKPVPKVDNSFLKKHNLQDKFIILYSGNIGKTHDIDRLVDVAVRLKEDDRFMFILIGEGGKKELIAEKVEKENLENFMLLPFQSMEVLPHSMGAADVCVVTTDKQQSALSIPSKTYSFLSVGAAFLCITDKKSELARLVEKENIGKCFSADEIDEMVVFLQLLADDEDMLKKHKINARELSFAYTPKNAKQYLKV